MSRRGSTLTMPQRFTKAGRAHKPSSEPMSVSVEAAFALGEDVSFDRVYMFCCCSLSFFYASVIFFDFFMVL